MFTPILVHPQLCLLSFPAAPLSLRSPTLPSKRGSLPINPLLSGPQVHLKILYVQSPLLTFWMLTYPQPNDPTPDNESLEHLGDSVVNLCTTRCIQALYPLLQVGPASVSHIFLYGSLRNCVFKLLV